MSYTEYVEPSYISYHTYENEMNDRQQEIDNLQEENYKLNSQLEEATDIINTLKKELKRYEEIIRKNNISL